MNILIFGMPGSGKGTISNILKKEFNLSHLSQGEILRNELNKGNIESKKIKSEIESKGYVPNQLSINLILNKLKFVKNDFILDGFPRSIKQKEVLSAYMKKVQIVFDHVVYLNVSENEALKRIRGRKRTDETEMLAKHRLEKFKIYTLPVIESYRNDLNFLEINGNREKEKVIDEILSSIKKEDLK